MGTKITKNSKAKYLHRETFALDLFPKCHGISTVAVALPLHQTSYLLYLIPPLLALGRHNANKEPKPMVFVPDFTSGGRVNVHSLASDHMQFGRKVVPHDLAASLRW